MARGDDRSFPAWEGGADTPLFQPISLGPFKLEHRIGMAPLTRLRADPKTLIPNPLAKDYYAQRASKGGLLISEATFISPEASGLKGAPGIFTQDQCDEWKKINSAVHEKGGFHFCQFWFLGRVADPTVVNRVLAASDIQADKSKPVELTVASEEDLERILKDYKKAAEYALEAGFDGIELHGANGYFIDQFLQDVSNQRTDQYGGSVENRMRFPLKVMQTLASVFPTNRLGIRLSPFSTFQGMRESDPYATFIPWTKLLLQTFPDLAYIHVVESRIAGASDSDSLEEGDDVQVFRGLTKELGGGKVRFLTAGGWDPRTAVEHAKAFPEDLVVFGRYFIANPDLPERIKQGHPMNHWDRSTFYSEGAKGYTDLPSYEEEQQKKSKI